MSVHAMVSVFDTAKEQAKLMFKDSVRDLQEGIKNNDMSLVRSAFTNFSNGSLIMCAFRLNKESDDKALEDWHNKAMNMMMDAILRRN